MKKIAPVAAFAIAFLAAGCAKTPVKTTVIDEETAVIIVPETTYETLEDYLALLKSEGKLTYEGEKGDYGLFITSVNGKENEVISSSPSSSEGYAWTAYIAFTVRDGVIYAGDGETCIYGDKTLYKASYGVSALPCIENCTYALVYEHYEYSW